MSEDSITVFANPFLIKDPVKVAARLAPLIGRPEDELLRKLSDRETGFVYLRRKMDATQGEKIEKLKIEGIGTVTEPKRTYPQGFLASQVLGLVGTDNVGLSGLEYSQDESLSGEDGERRLVKDALGEPVSMIETEALRSRATTSRSRSTPASRSAPRLCWPRSARPTRRRAPPRS